MATGNDSRTPRGGFSLVEICIAAAIVGAAGLITLPAFSRSIRRSHTSEAIAELSRMWAASVTYYESDHFREDGTRLPKQFPAGTAPREASVECSCLTGGHCAGGSPVWNDPTWSALQFSMAGPHLYMPHYAASGTGKDATFVAKATGDLDCDGVVASFERDGKIDANGDVVGSRAPIITNELE
jgi:Tfp pilus assembly protein PilE